MPQDIKQSNGLQRQPKCCECLWCTGPMPPEMTVSISDIVNDSCTDCGDLNGDYTVTLDVRYFTLARDVNFDTNQTDKTRIVKWRDCQWTYTLPTPVCGIDQIVVFYGQVLNDPWRLQVDLRRPASAGGGAIVYVHSIGPNRPLCSYTDASRTIPFTDYTGAISGVCDASSSIVVVQNQWAA